MAKKKTTDLIPDEKNFNKHTEYGMSLLEKSMSKFGFVEAGVISEDGVIASGNARQETAVNLGIDDTEIIDIDGTKAVYLRLKGLKSDTPEFHELSLALNAVGKQNVNWDFEMIEGFPEMDFGEWGVIDFGADETEPAGNEVQSESERWFLNIEFFNENECQHWFEDLSKQGLIVKIVQ